jgi:steroid 5-alpha reductase family enzyme
MHMLDLYIVVLPVYHRAGFAPHWLDLVCVLAIGATLAAIFMKRLGDAPLWPVKDPRLANSLKLKN